MLARVFATKQKMTQAWTKSGKRVAVTCLMLENNAVIRQILGADQKPMAFELGYGQKKLKNMNKPLRSQLEKSGFSYGVKQIRQVAITAESEIKAGDTIKVEQMFSIGDVVNVQGTTKGRGFAGAVKRHSFKGGPKTHGQSDRLRAVGAIGQRTTPGRVFKGKRMPGHFGTDVQTVAGLTVLYINPSTQQIWLSGPVPGHFNCTVSIAKTGLSKAIELDEKASGIAQTVAEPVKTEEASVETTTTETAPVAETKEGATV